VLLPGLRLGPLSMAVASAQGLRISADGFAFPPTFGVGAAAAAVTDIGYEPGPRPGG
jgi:hypothetical protein